MKHLVLALSFCSILFNSFSCNLTAVSLVSYTITGSNHNITIQLCMGGGRTGVVLGADGATNDILIGLYRGAGPLNFVSYSPASITSPSTSCEMFGYDIGPQFSPPYDAQANLFFAFDNFMPGCANGFECTTSTALCGNTHSTCFNISMTLDAAPDSLRIYGPEGNGNPVAGCYPNPDMGLRFNGGLNVEWGNVYAELANEDKDVILNWQTLSETNNDQFTVERLLPDSHEWIDIGNKDGNSTSSEFHQYSLKDPFPENGLAYYRIKQIDFDGRVTKSIIISVVRNYLGEEKEGSIYPNPGNDIVWITGREHQELQIFTSSGKKISEHHFHENIEQLAIKDLSGGCYVFLFTNEDGEKEHELFIVE